MSGATNHFVTTSYSIENEFAVVVLAGHFTMDDAFRSCRSTPVDRERNASNEQAG